MQPFESLEVEFASWNGLPKEGMVACSSGTAALCLALEALQLPAGSQVIVPDLTMIACARAVTLAGLEPVFVDCGEDLLMTPRGVEQLACDGSRVSAVMVVHIYGRQVKAQCDEWWWPLTYWPAVIEDMAEAHGVQPHKTTAAATWSFYKNKAIAGEEGGAVWFRNPYHARLARQLRSHGFTDAHDFMHAPRGHNYRLANCLAQLVRYSLSQGDVTLLNRRAEEKVWDEACPDEWRMPSRDVCWVYDLKLPTTTYTQQDQVIAALHAADFKGARHCFKPMHLQPEYKDCRRVGGEVAKRMSRSVIYLPLDQCHRAASAVGVIRGALAWLGIG